MADWKYFNDVEVMSVFKEMGNCLEHYIIRLKINKPDSIFFDTYDVDISNSSILENLEKLKDGTSKIVYFAFGMSDIDIYKCNDGYFGITDSPNSGINIKFVLRNGELEKLIEIFKHS